MDPLLIILLYSFAFRCSVKDNTIGTIPIGFTKVNNEEKVNRKKDNSIYIFLGEEIPNIFKPFLITILIDCMKTKRALESS